MVSSLVVIQQEGLQFKIFCVKNLDHPILLKDVGPQFSIFYICTPNTAQKWTNEGKCVYKSTWKETDDVKTEKIHRTDHPDKCL